jgi:intracellular sulfur oxidation DsrE/DsrF family protein
MSGQQGVVIHFTSGRTGDWHTALRNVSNLYGDDSVAIAPELMDVVVNGEAVRFLLSTSPEAARITRMAEAGIHIKACANSLNRFGYASENLAEGVETVPSGVAEAVRLQQGGTAYLKLP